MNTNNPSDMKKDNHNEDVNENSGEMKNADYLNSKGNMKRMDNSTETSISSNAGDFRSGKGTGMSDEGTSNETEQEWQDMNGSQAGSGNTNSNNNRNKSASQK